MIHISIEPFNCRRWKYVVELPRLWSSARLKMEDDNLHDILSCDLSKVVSCLKVGVTESSFLDASEARDVVSLFESVDVTHTPQSVVGVLLGAIQQVEYLHLRTLSVSSWWDLIDPILFTGLVRLETCSLFRIPAVQLEALFQAIIAADNINLKSLKVQLAYSWIRGVSPRLFQALTKLEEFKLVNGILPSECLTAMLAMPMLKKLVIRRTEVERTGVEPEPVESIVQSMEEHRLEFGTTPHLTLDFEFRSDGPNLSYELCHPS